MLNGYLPDSVFGEMNFNGEPVATENIMNKINWKLHDVN